MTTELEIIDTAIKVGLGALISGFTTYFVTSKSHKHEIKRTSVSDKREILKQCALKLEESSSLINQANSAIHEIAIGGEAERGVLFRKVRRDYTVAYNRAKEARAFCYLVGQQALGELVAQYLDLVEALDHHYGENGLEYDVAVVDANTESRTSLRTRMLVALGEAFDAIYT